MFPKARDKSAGSKAPRVGSPARTLMCTDGSKAYDPQQEAWLFWTFRAQLKGCPTRALNLPFVFTFTAQEHLCLLVATSWDLGFHPPQLLQYLSSNCPQLPS